MLCEQHPVITVICSETNYVEQKVNNLLFFGSPTTTILLQDDAKLAIQCGALGGYLISFETNDVYTCSKGCPHAIYTTGTHSGVQIVLNFLPNMRISSVGIYKNKKKRKVLE